MTNFNCMMMLTNILAFCLFKIWLLYMQAIIQRRLNDCKFYSHLCKLYSDIFLISYVRWCTFYFQNLSSTHLSNTLTPMLVAKNFNIFNIFSLFLLSNLNRFPSFHTILQKRLSHILLVTLLK